MSNNQKSTSSLKVSRIKLVLVFAFFFGPLLVAFIWYYGLGSSLMPSGRSNYSPLIQPVVVLQDFENPRHPLQNTDTKDDIRNNISLETLKRKWTIIHLIGASCDSDCQKSIYNTRQTRIALGKDTPRVQRLFIVEDAELANRIHQKHRDTTPIAKSGTGLENQLMSIIKDHQVRENDALLIDPLGNVMMVIPVDLDPGLLLKDLKKLLKLSRIG